MIEMFIIAAIVSSMTLRVAGNVAVDGLFAARGKESPRYTRAKARRTPGAASRYWSEVWDDVWTGMSAKRAARKSDAGPVRTPKPRGAATQFFAGLAQDGRRAARRSWEDGWTRLDEKRRTKATRPRPGQVTVPGTVVPNAQDESQDEDRPHQDRPQDEDRPDPTVVPDEDGTDRVGLADLGEDGIRVCSSCGKPLSTITRICQSCIDKQEDEIDRLRYPSDFGPDNQTNSPLASTTTQEGTTTMTTTIPTGEIAGLEPAISFFEASAQAFSEQAVRIEQTLATLDNLDVSGPARTAAASSMEQSLSSAGSMTLVADELKKHRIVAEAIDATPGAGKREFYTAGR